MNKSTIIIGIVALLVIIGIATVYSNKNEQTEVTTTIQKEVVPTPTTETNKAAMPAKETGVLVGGAMMLPSLDIVENAVQAKNVTTVVAAVTAAGLVDTLKGPGPFTVFAPNNSAFEKLPAGTVEIGRASCRERVSVLV